MPEHVHVLLCPRLPDYEMRRILVALKRPVSDAAKAHLEQTGNQQWLDRLTVVSPTRRKFRFWQAGGGYDRNVMYDKSLEKMVEYIHANPVRRRLVDHPTDWSWSSARFWEGSSDVPIQMDELPM